MLAGKTFYGLAGIWRMRRASVKIETKGLDQRLFPFMKFNFFAHTFGRIKS